MRSIATAVLNSAFSILNSLKGGGAGSAN